MLCSSLRKNRYKLDTEEDDDSFEENNDIYDIKIPDPDHIPCENEPIEILKTAGKTTLSFTDGRREVKFENGVERKTWPDGYSEV